MADSAFENKTRQCERPFRGSQAAQCVALLGALLLIPGISDSGAALARVVQHNVQKKFSPLAKLATPHLGEEVLPPQALEIILIARKFRLEGFSISPRLESDPLIQQRVTEGAWPMHLESGSKHRFLDIKDPMPSDCQLQENSSTVVYAVCR